MSRVSDISQLPQDSPARPSPITGRIVWSIVAVWFLAMLALSLAGRFDTDGAPPIPIALGAVLPVLIFLAGWAAIPALRAFALGLSPRALVGIHAVRIVGVVFLILYYRGILPGAFALPAGWGDIAVAVTAPLIALNYKRLPKGVIVAWTLFGMFDLLNALTMGVLNSQSPLGVLAHDVTTRPMGQFPLSLIPAFAIPVLLISHLIVLLQLRHKAALPSDGAGHHAHAS
jgi:hypothetical protein